MLDVVKLHTDISRNIRKIRRELDITQTELSIVAGVSRYTITSLEGCSHSTDIETLCRLCFALKCDLSDIIPNPMPEIQ